jgi:hypothetical protein
MAEHAPIRVEAHRCASTALHRCQSRSGIVLDSTLGTYCGIEKLLMHTLGWATAGAGGSSTLIALGTDAAVEAFCSGKAVLGDDLSLSLGAVPNPIWHFDRFTLIPCEHPPLLHVILSASSYYLR